MIDIYFGLPGSGKTTLACKLARKALRDGRHVYSDFSVAAIKGCINFPQDLLGQVTLPPGSLLILDEASIKFNNRNFKSMSMAAISWLKLARHYGVDVVVFSQSYEDMDITIRRLANTLWHVRRCGIFTLVRRINRSVGIDSNTHQIVDQYRFCSIFSKFLRLPLLRQLFMPVTPWYFVIRRFYYPMFDSWAAPELRIYDFK